MTRPALTRMDVLNRAWPLVFANATVPLAGVTDTFVLGVAGDASDLGGVALGAAIFNIFYWSFYFLRMGTTGLAAQADGAEDRVELQRVLIRAVALAAILGLLVFALRDVIAAGGFAILQGEAAVNDKGEAYFSARAWGAPAAFGVFALTGWLIGMGRTKATLAIHALFSGVNIGLDFWFVLGLGMGPGGVGAATAIAEWTALIAGLGFVLYAIRQGGGWEAGVSDRRALLDANAMRALFDVNFNLMIRTWCLILGFTWFVNAGARQGTFALAGNHVLLQVITLWAFVLDAFAYVAEAEAGRAFGRKSCEALRRALRLTAEPALAAGAIFAVVTILFGPAALTAIISDPQAREAAIAFLPYCAVVPILGAPAWILDGVFIGATRGAMLRNAGIAAVLVYLAADFLLSPPLGNHGVWLAFLVFYIGRAGALAAYYPALERRLAPSPSPQPLQPS
ncbi:MAG: MATE family efflux transporter [Maricaulaceae bacterium]|nr:MATE family efflux transporter [Maricaulaceae bacterium]